MAKRATGGSPRDPEPPWRVLSPRAWYEACRCAWSVLRRVLLPKRGRGGVVPPWWRLAGRGAVIERRLAEPWEARQAVVRCGLVPARGPAGPCPRRPPRPKQAAGGPVGGVAVQGEAAGGRSLARRPGATPRRASQGAESSCPMAFLRRQRGVEARRARGHGLQGAGRGQQPGGRKCPGAGAACEDTPEGVWAGEGQGMGWPSARDGPGNGAGPGRWGASGSNHGLQPTPGSAVGGGQAGRGTAPRCG